jgi:hypothetical protein
MEVGESQFKADLGKVSKNQNKSKKAGDMAQVGECLPCKALYSKQQQNEQNPTLGLELKTLRAMGMC